MTVRSISAITKRLLLIAAFCSGTSKAASAPLRIDVDGKPLAESGSKEIPASAKKVTFNFGKTAPGAAPDTVRTRFRLQGRDSDWREVDGGSSTFTVCFYDQAGNRFGLRTYEVKGRSAGWNPDVESTTFTHRHEAIVVPEGANSVDVIVSSAGSPASVGVYLVKDIFITRNAQPDGDQQLVLNGISALPSAKKTLAEQGPLWITDGTRSGMARILNLQDKGASETILAIVDSDSMGHAEWRLAQGTAPPVASGDQLTVEWEEAYETTVGDVTSVSYENLAPGTYRFLFQEVDAWGKPIGEEMSSILTVSPPYWQKPWFWGGIIASANVFFVLLIYGLIRMKARRNLIRTRLLEQERFRIARDLHDDLGARLTHLSLLSYNASNRVTTPEDRESFREFSVVTSDMVAALSETIWTVNPKNDHLDSLVGFLCRMITMQCKASNLRCRIDALALADRRSVPSDMRHDIVLAVKETINNAIKHSGSDELYARIGFESPRLHITITDRGCGFAPEAIQEWSNGLRNVKDRMDAVKGTATVTSKPGEGTSVLFEIPIP